MATETTPDRLRGLLVNSERFALSTIDANASSYTESGYEPDQPVATVSGYQTVEAGGSLGSDAAYSLRLSTTKAGAAVGGDAGGRYRWRYADDDANHQRGGLTINKATGWEYAAYSPAKDYSRPHCLSTPGHDVIAVYSNTTDGQVECQALNPQTNLWTTATVTADVPGQAAVVLLPSGRLVCIYVRNDLTEGGSNFFTFGASHSDDSGATWSEDVRQAGGVKQPQLVTAAAVTSIHLRAVYHDGFITCLWETQIATGVVQRSVRHLVSDDFGASWEEVEDINPSTNGIRFPELYAKDGEVITIYPDSGNAEIKWARKATPRGSFLSDPSWGTSTGIADAKTEVIATCLWDGGLFIYWTNNASTDPYNTGCARFDPDTIVAANDQWSASGDSTGATVVNWLANTGDDSNEYLSQFCVVPYKGGALMVHNTVAGGSDADNLGALMLGGYSSLDWRVQTFGSHRGSTPKDFGCLWVGSLDPSTVAAWTQTGAGTLVLNAEGAKITTSANQYILARSGPTSGAGAPVLILFRVKVETSAGLGSDSVGIQVRRADNILDYDVSVRLSTTGIRLYDNEAGAQVGSDVTGLDADVFRDYLLALDSNRAALYYKATGSTLWLSAEAGTLTNGGGGTTENAIKWGSLTSGTSDATWAFVGSCIDECQAPHGIQAFSNPGDLQGRSFDTAWQWLGESEGLLHRAKGGPTVKGDTWTYGSRAQYGVHNLCPEVEPSPVVDYRSTGTTEGSIVWNPNSGSATRFLTSSIGVYVARANMDQLVFEGKVTGSGSPGTWTTLGTLNQHESIDTGTLTADLDGDWLRPASATAAGDRFVEGGSLIGGVAIITWTGGGGGTSAHGILDNSAGVWRDPGSSRALEIRVDGDTSSISGTITVELIPPASMMVIHGVTPSYEAYRLRIPASQTTPTADYRIGVAVIGEFVAFGKDYSLGRVQTEQALVEDYEYANGAIRRRALNSPRKRVEFQWTEIIATSDLYGADPDPEYVAARAGFDGIALRRNPSTLAEILRRTHGAEPVVYSESVPAAAGAGPDAVLARGLVYGWASPVNTRTTRSGEEGVDESITIDATTITEIK